MKSSYFVYILKCADDTLYCGYTFDLEKRLSCHNAKKGAKYTKGRLPVSLVYFESFALKSDAMKREYRIKQMTRQEKLDLINASKNSNN